MVPIGMRRPGGYRKGSRLARLAEERRADASIRGRMTTFGRAGDGMRVRSKPSI